MEINILELSSLEVDEKIPESADQYHPTSLRISDVSRVAEGLTNPAYRADVIKQLTTVLARLPIIWAIRDTEAKLRELGTESRFPDRTCNRLKDFADYTYQMRNRQKDKDYIEKQKLLRTVNWSVCTNLMVQVKSYPGARNTCTRGNHERVVPAPLPRCLCMEPTRKIPLL